VVTNNAEKRDGLAMRLLVAVCENVASWILRHEFGASPPYECLMFMTYHGVGWEEAMMYQSMARIKQGQDRIA
jgi:hypothetical protein